MQKPLAIAIIGGMVTDVLIGTLFVLPVLYLLIARKYPATPKVIDDGDLGSDPAEIESANQHGTA